MHRQRSLQQRRADAPVPLSAQGLRGVRFRAKPEALELLLPRSPQYGDSEPRRPLGQSFTYAAGVHIDRPGRTRVTILGAVRTARRVELLARLDWSSPSTHYIGSGVYDLTFESAGPSTISYDAVKVVIKLPEAGSPTAANPVVRRNEHCAGLLTR